MSDAQGFRRWAKAAVFLGAALWIPAPGVAQSYEVLHAFTLDGAYPESTLIQATDGSFYGTTPGGGANSQGTVFKMDSSGNLTTLYSFTGGSDGANPYAGLIQATDGNFYGTTYLGGANNDGSVFKVDSAGNLTTLHSFTGSDGANPYAGLIQAGDGNFYGTTAYGGVNNYGTVFKMDSSGNLTTLHSFLGIDGSGPAGTLVQATDGNFYGTAYFGGASGWGTVFKMDSAGNLTVLYSFDYEDGAGPASALIQGTDGNLYGTASYAGASGEGTVFKTDSAGNLTVLYTFAYNDGANPSGALIQGTDGNFYGTAYRGGANSYGIVFKMDSAGDVTTLHSFAGSDGGNCVAALIQAGDGNFYGTTSSGGASSYGTVFKMDSSGNLTTLHSFGYSDGANPYAGLIQAADGNFYGTTVYGGTFGTGTVFKMDSSSHVTALHSFAGSPDDGARPYAGLIQATDGNFYGTTWTGGASSVGIIFKMDLVGNLTTLHSFAGSDGANPNASLIQATDGNFYGTTANGGANGTLFKMDSAGNLTTLHSFAGSPGDGANPLAGLIQASDGNFYGTTAGGGTSKAGTVFKMDSSGNLTTLYSFTGGSNGAYPQAALIQATDGNFYGTTNGDGNDAGTVFKMDSAGNVTTLHSFAGSPGDGANPLAGLIQATDGDLYGTTVVGGASGYGTLFKIDFAGNLTILHGFGSSDGAYPDAGLIEATDSNLYGTTNGGGPGGGGVVFRLTMCSPAPTPIITVIKCLPGNTPGFIASVPGNAGDTYYWTLTGGTIDSGQGTNMISFTSGNPGMLMSLGIVETNSSNCSGSALQNLQVDYADEPPSDPFYNFVCTIGRDRVTAGCGGGNFCPTDSVTRAQMAVLLLRAEHGAGFLPSPCTGIFQDVPCPAGFAVDWIEELYREGITAGCGGGNFCPDMDVTRAQMAVFLLTAKHGPGYQPASCTGIFQDVPCPGGFAVDWIEELYREGISAGCSASPPLYCPDDPNTRGQMAVFLVTTFNLQ